MPSYPSSCWYGGRCRLKNDNNDTIDEETSEDGKTDSVRTKVNDEEWTDFTPSIDMVEGIGKRKDDKNDRIAEEKDDNDEKNDDEKEAECPVLTPPIDMEEGVGKKNWQEW